MTGANGSPYEPRFRDPGADAQALMMEWRGLCRACLDEAREYTREHPAESLAVVFLAGTLLGAILGRRS